MKATAMKARRGVKTAKPVPMMQVKKGTNMKLTVTVPAELAGFVRAMERSGVSTNDLVAFALGILQEVMSDEAPAKPARKAKPAAKGAPKKAKSAAKPTAKKSARPKAKSKRR